MFIRMVTFCELRVCKRCGTVFSIQVGSTKISNCPQCESTEFEIIEEDKELVQE
jgi:predicted  nucleic acid-binding Zn-ribbon protein